MKRRNVLGWLGLAPMAAVAGKEVVASAPEPETYFMPTDGWYWYSGYDPLPVSSSETVLLDRTLPSTVNDAARAFMTHVRDTNELLQKMKAKGLILEGGNEPLTDAYFDEEE